MIIKLERILFFILASFFLLPNASRALAASDETQYGVPYGAQPGKPSGIEVNKEVFNPVENKFVDNIPVTGSKKFTPGEEIKFRFRVKNSGDTAFGKIEVKDTLPIFFESVSGELAFEVKDFAVNQTIEREIRVRVVSDDKLPQDQTVICDERTTNAVEAKGDGQSSRDTALVCIERKPVKELPKAGSFDTLALAFSSVFAGIAGLGLFKLRSNKRFV